MKFKVFLKGNIYNLMRQCGYILEKEDKGAGELAFIRPLGGSRSGYPRFHAYILVSPETLINLHLDQKKPVYKGSSAHAAEYEGETVEKEMERIKKILGP